MSFTRDERWELHAAIACACADDHITEAKRDELQAIVDRESVDASYVPSASEQQRYLELATDPTENGATWRYIMAGRPGDIETFTRQLARRAKDED